jgi:hypothetical protein
MEVVATLEKKKKSIVVNDIGSICLGFKKRQHHGVDVSMII